MASIFLRGRVWWISYYPSPGSKPIQRSLKTKDKTIAKFKKNEIENELVKGVNPLPEINANINSVLDQFIASKHGIAESTKRDYKNYIKRFLEYSRPIRLIDINQAMLDKYIRHCIENGLSPDTINHLLRYLKSFLKFALIRNYVPVNPIIHAKQIKIDRLPPRFLDKKEIKNVLSVSEDETIYPMIATAIYTGMRWSELKRLELKDIDFARREIMVEYSKSKTFRTIPLHPNLEKILLSIRHDGKIFNLVNWRRVFKRIKKKARLPDIGWHTFRHTFASQLIMNGVDIVTVSKLLGHSSIKTTMIYSHLTEGHKKEAIRRIDF